MKWVRQQLAAGQKAHRKSIVFMHHNLYAHNEAVNQGFVLDNSDQLKTLLKAYHVPLLFPDTSMRKTSAAIRMGNVQRLKLSAAHFRSALPVMGW